MSITLPERPEDEPPLWIGAVLVIVAIVTGTLAVAVVS